jgi:hypothetical protein
MWEAISHDRINKVGVILSYHVLDLVCSKQICYLTGVLHG